MEPQAEEFHHPYSPYDIQLQFMRALYSCIEKGKVAVFESPTGTVSQTFGPVVVSTPPFLGKSLSIICGSLTWLRDHKRKVFQETVNNTTYDDGEPEWMLEYAKRESSRAVSEKRKELQERLAKARHKEEKQKIALENSSGPRKRQKFDVPSRASDAQTDNDFALDDYDSEGEEKSSSRKRTDYSSGLSTGTLELLKRFQHKSSAHPRQDEDYGDEDIKILYCSRTHSQLTQFASELRRVNMPSSIPKDFSEGVADTDGLQEGVRHLSLGSRKNLCINPRVSYLDNVTAISERCLDMQQPGVAAEQRCPFLPSNENEAQVLQFRDHVLATVKDIEDIGKLGKDIGICPYYASRSVTKHSEIVTLPYPLLLQRSARDALDLSIKGHVVVIDEAHNLMDAISNIHSVTITLSELQTSLFQLTTYARKFKTRLKGKNRNYIAQVIRLVTSITDHLKTILETSQAPEGPVQPSDLMSGKGVDQINPYKLCRYLRESKLARKVDGYSEFSRERADRQADRKPSTPVLFHIQSFLLPLMNLSAEGKLFYIKAQGDIQLKYMLLDPMNQFREIVDDARAVILAGGTMSPMTDYIHHLFPYVPSSRLGTFSYGHVIPPENLIAQVLGKGVTGTEFDFTFETRDSERMIVDLGRTMAALCQVIPDGVVAFFPSYDYLSQVLSIWKRTLAGEKNRTVYDLIEGKKTILHESRDVTISTEELLQEYASIVGSGRGALLLSVVGGKLSEGINFSDRLGRGVLIVGLPFPNIRSAVWQAKIHYVEQKAYKESSGSDANRQLVAKAAGKDFYENSCMRAVNQCIGRAIRHRNDYAAIVLMDRRYDKPAIQGKLPAWIKQSMASSSALRPAGATIGSLSKFFVAQRTSKT
ncbi:ATP-dependent RNA helicase CHL1 [Aspergillus flavus]|uniref:ATP-dependent DNA helicase CHL1 n=1 Tax=Aspergillus flavus TaxID=5059 RepID=A0AB74C8S4_ASPFL|nr:ATP-dependent RNA helicase CHL1 [Aspergillus flavus]RMZ42267.1 ATP-dependent RNA helicase CHL1 [Aspergillus flavus]